jgi:hypothetical protein
MRRATTGVCASVILVLLFSAAGCTRNGGETSPPSLSAAAMVITEAEAQRVFDRYNEANAVADAALDATAIQEVQTGLLLAESTAAYEIHRRAGTKDVIVRHVRPTYLIPTVVDQPAFPRYFAVLSKRSGNETDRSSIVLYFTQAQAGGHWKATAGTWVVTEAARTSSSGPPGSAAPTPTGNNIRVAPKVLPELRHNVAGSGASRTVKFDAGSDTDILLGGGGRDWRSVEEVSSFAALFEVPGDASPATVLTSDAYGPQILSATGVRP